MAGDLVCVRTRTKQREFEQKETKRGLGVGLGTVLSQSAKFRLPALARRPRKAKKANKKSFAEGS
jgi:hypothetical protein